MVSWKGPLRDLHSPVALKVTLLVVPMLFIFWTTYINMEFSFRVKGVPKPQIAGRNRERTLKRILVYTSFFGSVPWFNLRPNLAYQKACGCYIDICEITYDKKELSVSDLVVFHGRDLPNYQVLKQLHQQRPLHQLWLFFIMENPYYTPNVNPLDEYFDLVSSYRLTPDIQFPYRFHSKKNHSNEPIDNRNYAKGKTGQIAWAVSHCGQQRERLARILADAGFKIDNYGRCQYSFTNSRKTERGKEPYENYKFYFAAENRHCKDYVSEKYWYSSIAKGAIPIAVGGANYSDPAVAIPGSFIDALKFPSPTELAKYLLMVDKNDTLYNEYFKWKRHWTFYEASHPDGCSPFTCGLCQKLHENSWELRPHPLTSIINSRVECDRREQLFKDWLDKG